MPKAEFDKVLQVHDGTASVSGPLTPDKLQPRTAVPHHVHWVLVQGDEVSAGLAEVAAGDSEWRSQESAPHRWKPGTAHAAGVIITIRPEPTEADPAAAVVETFTWSQRVTLEVI